MKLLLTSAGITNKTLEKTLLDMLGKPFEESVIAFMPTAANIDNEDKKWLVDNYVEFTNLKSKVFDIVDFSAVSRDIWQPRLEAADIMVFGGGNTYHLMYQLKKSGLAELIPGLLKNKVYVGISAGSMVTNPSLLPKQDNQFYYEEIGKYTSDETMDLVDFYTRPHLNDPYFTQVREEHLREAFKDILATIYVLDNNSAVKVVDDKVEVVSEGKWIKYN